MNNSTLASIIFSAFILGGIVVLMFVRELNIALVLLGIGAFGQLTAKLLRARQGTSGAEQDDAGQPATAPESTRESNEKPKHDLEGRSQ